MEKVVVVILMAGLSTRFEGPTNKQLALLKGKPIFSYSINAFNKSKLVDEIVLVVNKNNKEEIEKFIKTKKITAKIVLGGLTRQVSVECALKTIKCNKNDIVIIHDGARPLVSDLDIENVTKAAKKYGASTTYIEATDTIANIAKGGFVSSFEDRSKIALIQTPQAFKYDVLIKSHKNAKNKNATDDASLVLLNKGKIKLVKGNKRLNKVTTKEDLVFLEGLSKYERV